MCRKIRFQDHNYIDGEGKSMIEKDSLINLYANIIFLFVAFQIFLFHFTSINSVAILWSSDIHIIFSCKDKIAALWHGSQKT